MIALAPPEPGQPVYYHPVDHPRVLALTRVDEVLGYTVNGCYKVRDGAGAQRIVVRFPRKDGARQKAWKALG